MTDITFIQCDWIHNGDATARNSCTIFNRNPSLLL